MPQGASLFPAISKKIPIELETVLLAVPHALLHKLAPLASLALYWMVSSAKQTVPQTTPLPFPHLPPARTSYLTFILVPFFWNRPDHPLEYQWTHLRRGGRGVQISHIMEIFTPKGSTLCLGSVQLQNWTILHAQLLGWADKNDNDWRLCSSLAKADQGRHCIPRLFCDYCDPRYQLHRTDSAQQDKTRPREWPNNICELIEI